MAVIGIIIALGILSRLIHTGFVVLDKYLGDALYAAMVYGTAAALVPVSTYGMGGDGGYGRAGSFSAHADSGAHNRQ